MDCTKSGGLNAEDDSEEPRQWRIVDRRVGTRNMT